MFWGHLPKPAGVMAGLWGLCVHADHACLCISSSKEKSLNLSLCFGKIITVKLYLLVVRPAQKGSFRIHVKGKTRSDKWMKRGSFAQ